MGNNKKKTASKQQTRGDQFRDLEDKVENFMVATEKPLEEFMVKSKQTSHTLNSILRAIRLALLIAKRDLARG
ncbi:hypothetical protein GIB67_024317 [Kingdonia uniflora]|uniref:Uncharacterized protein n=1 Tax=Kingdonia uniflora TaxID=39325 RepID=A0A7J7LF34_9MAGN|nr:hypothetical protein GIB67_024317 [Kingdonia uniflora]